MVGPVAARAPRSAGDVTHRGGQMKTAIVGTAQGIFVVDAAGGGSSPSLAGPSVRHLSRINGKCPAGSTAGIFRSDDGGRTRQARGIGDRAGWGGTAAPGQPGTLSPL